MPDEPNHPWGRPEACWLLVAVLAIVLAAAAAGFAITADDIVARLG
jgi:hypothetical protein